MLDAPNLDDRTFQDLVDDAKLLVQQRNPQWTNHNVSDPGVTLIETFAYMVDQLLYRLNRVPDRLYVKFLELIGERQDPPSAAWADLTFWLAAPLDRDIDVPIDTVVSTGRRGAEERIEFSTVQPLTIWSSRLARCVVQRAGGEPQDVTEDLGAEAHRPPVQAFSAEPLVGDALLVGLERPAPAAVVQLDFRCPLRGDGVIPAQPPLAWRAWTGASWERCSVISDTTRGLNLDGSIQLQVPEGHAASVVLGHSLGWLKVEIVQPPDTEGSYASTPEIRDLSVRTVGGTVRAVNGTRVAGEVLGVSDGTYGQRFALQHHPVVRSGHEPFVVEVTSPNGVTEWTAIDHFGQQTDEQAQHVEVDLHAGEVVFAPAVRQPDGTLRSFGAVPPRGATVVARSYRFGGGSRGNVPARSLTALHSDIPMVRAVENRKPAEGGVDPESIEAVKVRGPATIRTRNRAVTARDYEELAAEVAAECRYRALDVERGGEVGRVRLLVVPPVTPDSIGWVELNDLVPDERTVRAVRDDLDARRCLGALLDVEPPRYQGVKVTATLWAAREVRTEGLLQAAQRALYGWLNPRTGGPDGTGWPFGRAVLLGELRAVLQRVEGCVQVDPITLAAADPHDPARGATSAPLERIALAPDTLVFSCRHELTVVRGEEPAR